MATQKTSAKTTTAQRPQIDYQSMLDALPFSYIAFWADDPDFTIAAQSPVHARLALVDRNSVIGRPVLDVWPDNSEEFKTTGTSDFLESLRTVVRTRKPHVMPEFPYDLPLPGGGATPKTWQITHYPVLDDAGKVSLIYQYSRDITDELATSNQLKLAQDQLDEALSVGMIGTYVWKIPDQKVVGDRNMALMFGVSAKAAAQGLPLASFTRAMYSEDRKRVSKEIQAILKSGDIYKSEYRTVNRDGEIRWLIARGHINRDTAGRPVTFSGILVDITERKLVENNLTYLAKASTLLSASLDYKKTLKTIARLMVPEIADWCTVDILGENGQLQQVGLAHKDPAKVKWAAALREKQGPPDLDEPGGIPQVIRTGKAEFYPSISEDLIRATAKSPEELKLLLDLALTSIIIVPLKIHRKTVGALSLITTDQKRKYTRADLEMAEELASRASLAMTNASLYDSAQKELSTRIRLEEELRVANEELESRVEARTIELEITNDSLQRSNQELQDFAYVASHDLQEPLRKIQAFGNLLESEYGATLGEGKDYVARMRGAAARMSALIEDILSFSRVSTKGRNFTPVNLRTVAREVIGDLEVRINSTGAVIEVGDLPTIHADAMQMRQLLQNLIANALKFHREGVPPVIKIKSTVETADDQPTDISPENEKRSKIKYCRLEIQDNGLGFDEKYLDRIFSVFQRLHNHDSYEGTGIGLAVCRKIVERHGGTITAASKLGKGSTFIITLPLRHKKGENLL